MALIQGRCRGCKQKTQVDELTKVCPRCTGVTHLQQRPVLPETYESSDIRSRRQIMLDNQPDLCDVTEFTIPRTPAHGWSMLSNGARRHLRRKVTCPKCGRTLRPKSVYLKHDFCHNDEMNLLTPEEREFRRRNRQDVYVVWIARHKTAASRRTPKTVKHKRRRMDSRQQPRRT